MSQSATINRRIVLNARPRGAPTAADFRIENDPVPKPEAGPVLLRTRYQSLAPYMPGRMRDGPSYVAPVAIGDVMVGGTPRWPSLDCSTARTSASCSCAQYKTDRPRHALPPSPLNPQKANL